MWKHLDIGRFGRQKLCLEDDIKMCLMEVGFVVDG
jgi:hypothetical protein